METIENYNNTNEELNIAKLRLEVIKENIKFLNKEKKNLNKLIDKLEFLLSEITKGLKNLTGTEHRIFYEIVINGLNVTKAIDKVASDLFKDPSTLWKTNYPKVKEKIDKLK